MTARTIVVTGGSQGLGFAAAVRFVQLGHRVVVTSRSAERAAWAAARVNHAAEATDQADGEELDLSRLDSVRALAVRLRSRHDRLHVLLANAALRPPRRRTVVDGREAVLATDHLGHFALAAELLPLLRAAARDDGNARVVVVSSRLHHPRVPGPRTRLDLDDLDLRHGYRPMRAYKNAKLANLLFAYEFDRRHGSEGVPALALCPGFVPTTIADDASGPARFAYRHVLSLLPFARTLDQAVDAYEHAALHPALPGGRFYVDSRPARSSADSYDRSLAQRLWSASAHLTQVRA